MEIKRGNRRNRPSFFIIKNLKVPQPVEAVGHARITHTVTYLLQGIQEPTRLVHFPHTSGLNDYAKQPNVAHSPRFGLQPSRSIIDNEKAFGMLLGQANTAGFAWIDAGMEGAPTCYLDTRFMQPCLGYIISCRPLKGPASHSSCRTADVIQASPSNCWSSSSSPSRESAISGSASATTKCRSRPIPYHRHEEHARYPHG